MDSVAVQERARELLGFRVTERENDAVVEFYEEGTDRVRAVRPAHNAEVTMYLRILGLVARLDEQTTQLSAALKTVDEQQSLLGRLHALVDARNEDLDSANARIQELEQYLPDKGNKS